MSIQIFLQARLLGIEQFTLAPDPDGSGAADVSLLAGRARWATLLMEVLPRALLETFGLARILLGTSGAGGFLVVLPQETGEQADEFLTKAAGAIARRSGGQLRLIWTSTENLGPWQVVQKRLSEQIWSAELTSREAAAVGAFEPFDPEPGLDASPYFRELAQRSRDAQSVGWSAADPGEVLLDSGELSWPVGAPPEGLVWARHSSTDDDFQPSSLEAMAARAEGRPAWGVLRGDVDGVAQRLRQIDSIEHYVQVSTVLKQFLAGELEVICLMPQFWQKVSILYSGGGDFAVYGAWDALIALAREIERLFRLFVEEQWKDLAGAEGKTITMAIALAPEVSTPFGFVYQEAGRALAATKAVDKDRISVFGATVDWKQLAQAGELKDQMIRLVRDFGSPPEFLEELGGFYREKPSGAGRQDRPWRYHRRLGLTLGQHRDRELQRISRTLIGEVIGRSPVQVRLRPAGRVAVSWARFLMEA